MAKMFSDNGFGEADDAEVAIVAGLSLAAGHIGYPSEIGERGTVIPCWHRDAMADKLLLRGTNLRYVLTMQLLQHGAQSVADLIDALEDQGFTTAGRPSKAISDALRWEMNHGRVYRIRHGRYRPAEMPRSTEYRIRNRVLELRAAAADRAA